MPKVKSKTTPKRQTVSTKTAEALRVLGLDPESRSISKRQIATNYRNQALIYHPDKVEHWTKEKMQQAKQRAQEEMQKQVQRAEEEMQKELQRAEEEMQQEVQWADAKIRTLNNARDTLFSVYP